MSLGDWIRNGWQRLADPQRDERVEMQTQQVHKILAYRKDDFCFADACDKVGARRDDRAIIAEHLLDRCIRRALADHRLSPKELSGLIRIGALVGIAESEVRAKLHLAGRQILTRVLAGALADGDFDASEHAEVEAIALSLGLEMEVFLQGEFRFHGEDILRNLFAQVWSDGVLTEREWIHLTTTARRLGFSDEQFRHVVAAQARPLVEHFLADFRNEDVLNQDKEFGITWFVDHIIGDTEYGFYVRSEMQKIKEFRAYEKGHLPSIAPPAGLSINAGEIVHFSRGGALTETRVRASGSRITQYTGVITITDDRLIFVSANYSTAFLHSRILGLGRSRDGFYIQVQGKPLLQFEFFEAADYGVEIYRVALGLVKQTIVSTVDNSQRYIPRDVRQRIWQRYGGRCAECGDNQYLEFDHIIPVAKGGGNSENNVQLLCRRCNLKKSDAI